MLHYLFFSLYSNPDIYKTARPHRKGRLGRWIDYLEWLYLGHN